MHFESLKNGTVLLNTENHALQKFGDKISSKPCFSKVFKLLHANIDYRIVPNIRILLENFGESKKIVE